MDNKAVVRNEVSETDEDLKSELTNLDKDADVLHEFTLTKSVKNTHNKKMSKERKKMIRKITANISNCEIEDKIHIFNVIGKKIDRADLQEEGLGVRIWFSIMDDILLNKINDLITDAIKKTKLNLDSDPESE